MVKFLTKEELLLIHARCIEQTGGMDGIRE